MELEKSPNKDLSQFSIEMRFQLLRDTKGKFWLEVGRKVALKWCGKDRYTTNPYWSDHHTYEDYEHQAEPVSLLAFLLETGEDARASVRRHFTKTLKYRFY